MAVAIYVITALFIFGLIAWAVLDSKSGAPKRRTDQMAQIICPHCQTKGTVTSRREYAKRGVSGGKAAGAVLTGGASMLATGLSRKEWVTRMKCSNCRTAWVV